MNVFAVITFIVGLLFASGQLVLDQDYEPGSMGAYAFTACSSGVATVHIDAETAPQEVWLHELAHAYDCATGPGVPGYYWPGEENVPEWMLDERSREYVLTNAPHCVQPVEYYACRVVFAAKFSTEIVDPILILHGADIPMRDPEDDGPSSGEADFMWDPLPQGRVTLSVFLGEDIDDLVRSVTPYTSVHGTMNGAYVSYIPGAPIFVNSRFLIEFPFPNGRPFVIVQ